VATLPCAWASPREPLEEAMKYSQERKQFGKDICEFQSVQLMLADMALKVEASRMLIYRAVVNAGAGLPSVLESNLAKCFANEMVREVTGLALQLHGGYGYSKDYPIERMFRDGWGWGIAGGTIQIQKIRIASTLSRSAIRPAKIAYIWSEHSQ